MTIMQSLEYGLSSAAHIGGATTTARSCLTAIGAMAAESLRCERIASAMTSELFSFVCSSP